MIGQSKIIERFKYLIENNKFPRFILLVGGRGWGKDTLCKEISKMLKTDLVLFGNKVDDLRECIQLAYEQKSPILYTISGGDTMSIAAKNSILKLIEEPPNNAYIIMQIENEQSTLPTILSRAYLCKMDNYTMQELKDYISKKDTSFTNEEIDKIVQICDSPGSINILLLPENKEIMETASKVAYNIDKITLSNLLKVSKKIKTTESTEGMDLGLFLNCLQYYVFSLFIETKDERYYSFYAEIIKAKGSIRSNSINKLYVLDNLLIGGWKIWKSGN